MVEHLIPIFERAVTHPKTSSQPMSHLKFVSLNISLFFFSTLEKGKLLVENAKNFEGIKVELCFGKCLCAVILGKEKEGQVIAK